MNAQLNTDLKNQLKDVFAKLNKNVVLTVFQSQHPEQSEMIQFMSDIASTSDAIRVEHSPETADAPTVDVHLDNHKSNIRFVGIPTGHELSSLVLAVLNSAGLGQMPDPVIQRRIRALALPSEMHTYISLTCTNCPNVVQMMNQIALIHGDMKHLMIDGGVAQEAIEQLSIQSVPSVMDKDKLIAAGRQDFVQLIDRLQERYGRRTGTSDERSDEPIEATLGKYDLAILGGGPSGITAAIYAARKGLKTVLIADRIGGQLMETKGIENMPSINYIEGPELSANLKKHLKDYPIEVLEHRKADEVTPLGSGFGVHMNTGERLEAARVLLATGAKWKTLNIPGEKEYLGKGVAFCPHCDGPLYKDKRIAVIGGGNSGIEAAIDLSNIAAHVTVLEFSDALKADAVLVEKAQSTPNIDIITSAQTLSIEGDDQSVYALRYLNRVDDSEQQIELAGVFIQIGLAPNSAMVKDLVELTPWGEIQIDEKCRTTAPGLYAAGDVSTVPYKQISISMGEGAKAALSIFEDHMHSALS